MSRTIRANYFGATRIFGFGLAVALLVVLLAARPAHAAEFAVNSTGDAGDATPDGVCDSTAGSTVTCTLREAIDEANATPAPDSIKFEIPNCNATTKVCTISPTSPLTSIKESLTIDGYTQPEAAANRSGANAKLTIELNGANAGASASGLAVGGANADGTTIKGLVINRFGNVGVFVDSPGTVIQGNYIGTNAAGDADLGNGINGVRIRSSGNLIGGPALAAENVISGNGDNGVVIDGLGASNNRIEGNRIGTDANGTSALGNGQGVNITSASGNFVGGPEVGASNFIAGNVGRGVLLAGDATGNLVQGNFIGAHVSGSADLGNGAEGVEVFEGSNNVIGGTASRTGNIISGNDRDGVELNLGANDNRVQGNLIGTGQDGASDLGNGEVGVLVRGPGNLVGGTGGLARNVISGNGGVGVSIINADGTTVQGNRIGPGVNGEDLGGQGNFHGVFISPGSSDNTIGGTAFGAANTISFNDNHGVVIEGFAAGTTGNRVIANSIHSNGLLGINLSGGVEKNGAVTENDKKDKDSGPNLLQNFPVITSATATRIKGTLSSTPNKTFTVQFFSNPQPNFPTGFGEGQNLIGQASVTTSKKGKASFTVNLAAPVPAGHLVTATATDPGGNTSEFSAARAVQ